MKVSRWHIHPVLLLIVTVGLGGAFIASAFLLNPLSRYLALSLILAVIGAVGIRWGAISYRLGKLDLLELPVWYTLWTFVSLVPFGFLVFVNPEYLYPATKSIDWVPSGLWLLVLGLLGLWMGYRLGWMLLPSNKLTTLYSTEWRPLKPIIWLFYALIWLERLWRISTVGIAYGPDISYLKEVLKEFWVFNQWSIYLEGSVYLVIAIVALQVFHRRWPLGHLLWILALELFFIFLTGFMKPLLLLVLVIVASLAYSGYRYRFRPWLLLSLLVAGILLIPVTERFRVLILIGEIDIRSLSSVLNGVFQAFNLSWGSGIIEAMQILIAKIASRQVLVAQTLGILVHLTPESIPYWGIERLLMIPLYIVPRVFWPDKPILSIGREFGILYLGAPPWTKTSYAATMFGDLYMSAGWGAVFLGMVILGIMAATLYHFLRVQPLRRGQVELNALYIGLVVCIAVDEYYVPAMVGLIQRLVVFGVLFRLMHLKFTHRTASARFSTKQS